jgi:hypothetical protein
MSGLACDNHLLCAAREKKEQVKMGDSYEEENWKKSPLVDRNREIQKRLERFDFRAKIIPFSKIS